MSAVDDPMRDDLNNAGISPRERLQRIEELLGRVDAKLDNKANASDVVALELRVRALETSGGERVQEMRERVGSLDGDVRVIGRRLAYATGTLASVIVMSNMVVAWFISH